MPIQLHKEDRKILIVAGLGLAVVLVLAVFFAPGESAEERPQWFPSSYSARPGGAKGAFLLLREVGYSVERWELPASRLPRPAVGVTLILAEPWRRYSQLEVEGIRAFAQSGGRVLATGAAGARLLPDGAAISERWPPPPAQDYPAAVPSALTAGLPVIRMSPRAAWTFRSPAQVAIYAAPDQHEAAVVSYTAGKGRVVWWAAAGPLTNAGLSDPRNVTLLLNSLGGPPSRSRVLWDEYHHGSSASLGAYVTGTPVKWLMAQALLVFLLALLTFGRRNGPVRAPAVLPRTAPLEFVETMGDLYYRGQAAAAAVETAYQRFRYLLVRRLGLPANVSVAELAMNVRERLQWNQPGFGEELRLCESAIRDPDLTNEMALHRIQALHDYIRLLRLAPQEQR